MAEGGGLEVHFSYFFVMDDVVLGEQMTALLKLLRVFDRVVSLSPLTTRLIQGYHPTVQFLAKIPGFLSILQYHSQSPLPCPTT